MTRFSREEIHDLLILYGECGRNAVATIREYQIRFPNRYCPSRQFLPRLFAIAARDEPPQRNAQNEEEHLDILQYFIENPSLSVRKVARISNFSKSYVHKILKKYKMHPYHMNLVQELSDVDLPRRNEFCMWIQEKVAENPNFHRNILFTDECCFSNKIIGNRKNEHQYSFANPHWKKQRMNQHIWSCNVWCGIVNNKIIGPYFLEGNLNSDRYINFIENELDLEEVDLETRRNIWFQQDGAPAHTSRHSLDVLRNKFGLRIISNRTRHPWPARSPDLTPLDYFLWGYIKNKLCVNYAITTKENMKRDIREICNNITTETLEAVNFEFLRRINFCVENNGDHFEHLL